MRFFDANVLVYRQDARHPGKQAIARDLIESAMAQGEFVLSTQVLQEFYSVMLRKNMLPAAAAQALCETWMQFDVVSTTPQLLLRGFGLQQRYQMAIWDALIVQAALDAGCTTLYSEDLQDGMEFGGLSVVNPFVLPAAVHEPPAAYGTGKTPRSRRKRG